MRCVFFCFIKQKTAYEMRISDWSSDVCSSDLSLAASSNYALTYRGANLTVTPADLIVTYGATPVSSLYGDAPLLTGIVNAVGLKNGDLLESVTDGTAAWTSAADATSDVGVYAVTGSGRSEEPTSELQSLMR